MIIGVSLICTSLFALNNSVYAQIENIDPLTIERENGKKFKIDPDFLGVVGDDPSEVQINLDAKDTKVKIERGEDIEVSFDTPFGDPESAKVVLLDGSVAEITRPPGIEFIGDEEVFFDERLPFDAREFEATVSDDIQKGIYKLVVQINFDENNVYFVTKAKVI